MVQTHFDSVGGERIYTYPSQVHFVKTLELLRKKIMAGNLQAIVLDATLFSVSNLATHAHIYGEDKASKQHLEAIRSLVDLRGGLAALGQMKLQIEVVR